MNDELLRETLHRRAAAAPLTRTPLEVVAGRARRVRRRQRGALALGAAAVVAGIVVPLSLVGGPAEAPPADPAPPVASQPTESTAPGLAPDTPPRIGYAQGTTYHLPDGTTERLPDDDSVWAWSPAPGQVLSATAPNGESEPLQVRLSEDGVIGDGWCSYAVPALAADGAYAFTMVPCTGSAGAEVNITLQPADGQFRTASVPEFTRLVGFVGASEVAYGSVGEDGVWVTDFEGEPRQVSGIAEATSTAPGRLAGRLDDGSWGVVTLDGEMLWSRTDLGVTSRLNPSGTLLLAILDDGRWAVLDAVTGQTVSVVEGSGPDDFPTYGAFAWEDDEYLLTTQTRNCCTAIVRIGAADGEPTVLSDGPVVGRIWSLAPTQG